MAKLIFKVMIMKLVKSLYLIIPALLTATTVEAEITTKVLGNDASQCVAYARGRVPSLPTGLTDWASKKKIINNQTCSAGSVAIIDSTSFDVHGHVAVVEGCHSADTGAIRITETNFTKGKKTERRASSTTIEKAAAELKIIGYYKP
ncbi:CHAP domain-containing protein [Thiothrix fructosivorans]|uniref:CHAP domain-containing protein n=1 Tax=Thiothrix fructosivorans TaxID=111770 RepID=A0A8B0SSU0_9GAMM|nr:CHAP domain-containing protein [Thiothrix fructosivorans]MBO0612553.1 CHAP domain-containing protein [Thiothrix fructosivorans]QTX11972.1 CHAP domain-containing protein [Thiothrix fructosivorans]